VSLQTSVNQLLDLGGDFGVSSRLMGCRDRRRLWGGRRLGRLGRSLASKRPEVGTHFIGSLIIEGARMGLLVSDSKLRKSLQNHSALDFQLACQFVYANCHSVLVLPPAN
jgi:hypothetical protein